MRSFSSVLALLALSACGSSWDAADLDGDGYSLAQGDCWESDTSMNGIASADIHPGAAETWYDGFDQDCAGDNDFDKDGDGHASAEFPDPSGLLASDDCWDDPDAIPDGFSADDPAKQVPASAVYPDAEDAWYDGIDADCAGDDDFDQDGDGYGSAAYGGEDCYDGEDDGFENGGGLDPAEVNPDAEDAWYDGSDADCADNDDFDQDGDGFGIDDDCDDLDPLRFPDPTIEEIWYDGIDQNCDRNDGDQDGDGFYAAGYAFEVPEGFGADDCWDDLAEGGAWVPVNGFDALAPQDVYPGADEIWYDGLDQDCAADGDFDQDADGYATDAYPDAAGATGADCDDTSTGVNPGAAEAWYDGIDQDCAGDDDFDQDADGYANDTDCDDAEGAVNPGAVEVCGNAVDENCSTDPEDEAGATGCSVFYADVDGDGYGETADALCLCLAADVYTVANDDDCDDGDPAVSPAAAEDCGTAADDDCDGGTNDVGATGCSDWHTDSDNDGYGTTASQCTCTATGTYRATNDDDCNDANAAVSPADTETCNSVDDDCDGTVDDGLPLYYLDGDGDSYGAGAGSCASSGRVATSTDCDDDDVYVYPGAAELCDGQANDCSTSGTWTADSEDGKVSYVTGTTYTDLSASFTATTAANYSLASTGEYLFCGGTHYTKLVGSSDYVTLTGVYGADETILVNNSGLGSTLAVTNGAITATGLTISGGVGSSGYGGGVIANTTTAPVPSTPTLTLTDCVVTGNTATYGGGVAAYNYGYVALDGTEIHANTATTYGGGVFVSATGKLVADGASIHDNDATGTGNGGGVYFNSSATTAPAASFTDSEIHANTAGGDGGGVYAGDTTVTLTGTLVYGNSAADDGGGLYLDDAAVTCTDGGIYANSAVDRGGGVYLARDNSATASFSAVTCDMGSGADDNSAEDVTIKTSGSTYADYTAYGATASFVCTNASDICTP